MGRAWRYVFQTRYRAYRVQGCSARTGQGLEDGFNWLFSTLGSQSALQSFHDPLLDPLQKFSKLRPESVAETESTADVESHMADIELSDGRTDNHGASHLGKHSKNQTISIVSFLMKTAKVYLVLEFKSIVQSRICSP